MKLSTQSLARASSRHPWRTIAVWVAVVLASVASIVTLLGSALSTEPEITADVESKRAAALMAEGFQVPEDERPEALVIVRSTTSTVDDRDFQERVSSLRGEIAALGRGVAVVDEPVPSEDRRAAMLPVALAAEDKVGEVLPVVEAADGTDGFDVEAYGGPVLDKDFEELSQHDLKSGELKIGAPAAVVILLLVFGSVMAAAVPLMLAMLAIVIALGLTAVLGQAWQFSFFVVNMITGVGLALGIDYSLFVISRYREERARGREKFAAIEAAGATASRAVFFSGLAVVLGLFGMVLVPSTIMRSLGAGAILVGAVSVLAALTLMPAILSLLGDRVDALRLPVIGRAAGAGSGKTEGRFWSAVARLVMRRPVVSLVLSAGVLLAATVPVLDFKTGSSGVSTLPDRLPSKQGFIAYQESFGGRGSLNPAQIVIAGPISSGPVRDAIDRLQSALDEHPAFAPGRVETAPAGDVAVVSVPVPGDPVGERAKAAVQDLRDDLVPRAFSGVDAEVVVGGGTAEELDYIDVMNFWLPIVLVFVLGLSFVLLAVAFRSIVVPLKAIALNLLSVGATYGLLVLVFQKGVGADLLGFQQVDIIEAWVPLFLFSLLFGLSMDYHVFLLSRIRERFRQTGDNTEAVAFGVSSTARIITGAAFIIVAVFVGFAAGDMVMFQQMGFGVAVSLFLDATIIRSVLVPASMKLLGERNWYLPSWLAWLPDVHVEGGDDGKEKARPVTA